MIGIAVTIRRVRPDLRRTWTARGTVTDVLVGGQGVTGVCLRGTYEEDGSEARGWYAVGPKALDGSLVSEQQATVDACGHDIDRCLCHSLHTCGQGVTYGCALPDCDGNGD